MRLRKMVTEVIASDGLGFLSCYNAGAIVIDDDHWSWFERDFSGHEAIRRLADGWSRLDTPACLTVEA